MDIHFIGIESQLQFCVPFQGTNDRISLLITLHTKLLPSVYVLTRIQLWFFFMSISPLYPLSHFEKIELNISNGLT